MANPDGTPAAQAGESLVQGIRAEVKSLRFGEVTLGWHEHRPRYRQLLG